MDRVSLYWQLYKDSLGPCAFEKRYSKWMCQFMRNMYMHIQRTKKQEGEEAKIFIAFELMLKYIVWKRRHECFKRIVLCKSFCWCCHIQSFRFAYTRMRNAYTDRMHDGTPKTNTLPIVYNYTWVYECECESISWHVFKTFGKCDGVSAKTRLKLVLWWMKSQDTTKLGPILNKHETEELIGEEK